MIASWLQPLSWIWIVDVVLALVAIFLAVTRGRGVTGTLAWIFAILALPFVGSFAYFLLANPSVRRTRRKKRLTAAEVRAAVVTVTRSTGSELSPLATSVIHLATRLTGIAPTEGNRVELLTQNAEAFAAIERAILEARRTIWTQYYIVNDDDTGNRFLDLLAMRAREGVDVRLLYDAVGSADIDESRVEKLRAAGGHAEAFLPTNPLRRRWAIQLRNHRKILVADGRLAFTGGMNVGDEYSGYSGFGVLKRKVPWRDTHLSIEGPAAYDLATVFAEDWAFTTGTRLVPEWSDPPAACGGSLVGLLPSGPDQAQNANALAYFSGAALSRERCYLTSPYFVPDEPMIRALESAALRGVDVRLLVPAVSDVAFVRAAAWSYFPSLLRAGVRIFQYRPAVLHAKTFAVDGTWGLVGSANVDIRSFSLNFEIGVLVFDPRFAKELEDRFLKDLEKSVEITQADVSRRGLRGRLSSGIARLFSPLL